MAPAGKYQTTPSVRRGSDAGHSPIKERSRPVLPKITDIAHEVMLHTLAFHSD